MQVQASQPAPSPWWRHGHVWLLLAGPVTVILAGFATLWIAMRSPDPLVATDYYRRGIEINRTLEQGAAMAPTAATDPRALMPAVQGRNHAATPAEAVPAR